MDQSPEVGLSYLFSAVLSSGGFTPSPYTLHLTHNYKPLRHIVSVLLMQVQHHVGSPSHPLPGQPSATSKLLLHRRSGMATAPWFPRLGCSVWTVPVFDVIL